MIEKKLRKIIHITKRTERYPIISLRILLKLLKCVGVDR